MSSTRARMKKTPARRRFTFMQCLLVLFIVTVLIGPLIPLNKSVAFECVADAHKTVSQEGPELFIIHDGHLYLRRQERWHALMTSFVRKVPWTSARLRMLRDGHPELESLLPDPAREDGGIPWLGET